MKQVKDNQDDSKELARLVIRAANHRLKFVRFRSLISARVLAHKILGTDGANENEY